MPYQREMYASMYNTFWRNFGKGFINGLRSIKEN